MKKDNNIKFFIFLLYVSVIFIVSFLQQEFVLLPELNGLDILGDESKLLLINRFNRTRWLAFLTAPVIICIRMSLVGMCLYLGSYFFPAMSGKKYKEWWTVALVSQSIFVFYSILLCIINLCTGENNVFVFSSYTSLLFFVGQREIEEWVKLPLSAINAFEIVYWCAMSLCVGKLAGTSFGKSFKFVMSSYGVGYLFYIALLMFLMLYLA